MSNRRKFIANATIVAGGASLLSNFAIAKNFFGKDVVRLGVIGTGDRGKGIISLANNISGLDVVAIADMLPFRLEEGQALAPKAKSYTTHKQLLDDKDVDAIVVATPLSTHDEIAIEALDADKHVYCEKTMAKGMNEIQAMVSKADAKSNLIFQTGHQYHSSQLYNKAREIIQSGYLGDVTAYHCQWNRNGDWRRPVPDPKWERQINWRMYREYSGGLVAELMSHQIDFINWVSGSRPERISGFGGIDHWKDGRETYDNVHLLFEYPDGLDASFSCTTTNGFEDYQVKVLGSKATMILGYSEGYIHLERKARKEVGIVDGVSGATVQAWKAGKPTKIDAPGNDPTIDALKQFRASIADAKPVVSDIRTGALTAKCVQLSLDALYDKKITSWGDYPKLNFE